MFEQIKSPTIPVAAGAVLSTALFLGGVELGKHSVRVALKEEIAELDAAAERQEASAENLQKVVEIQEGKQAWFGHCTSPRAEQIAAATELLTTNKSFQKALHDYCSSGEPCPPLEALYAKAETIEFFCTHIPIDEEYEAGVAIERGNSPGAVAFSPGFTFFNTCHAAGKIAHEAWHLLGNKHELIEDPQTGEVTVKLPDPIYDFGDAVEGICLLVSE